MMLLNSYPAFSFAGHVTEGLDGKIYCLDSHDNLFCLENNHLVFVKGIFDDYFLNVITGRGYIARCWSKSRHAVKIYALPPAFSRVVYVPRFIFVGYNADRKIAVLRGIDSSLICIDFSVRPARRISLNMVLAGHDNVNVDRMLATTYDHSGAVKVYDILKKDCILETRIERNAYFVYPVSEDALVIGGRDSFSVMKQGRVIFSGGKLFLDVYGVRSVGDRILLPCWPERWPPSYHYIYINTKTERRCIIFDCADAVLLSNGVAIRGALGHGWFIVPNEYLEEKYENLVFVGRLYQSDMLTSYSPTI